MLSKQSMVGLALVALVFAWANPMDAARPEPQADRRLREAFDALDEYVEAECEGAFPLNNVACIQKIKASQLATFYSLDKISNRDKLKFFKEVRHAAKVMLAVNGADKCDKKLVDQIDDLARLGPQKNYGNPKNKDGDSRLRQITGPLVERSIQMCEPFVYDWFKSSQAKLGSNVNSDLDKLATWMEYMLGGKELHKALATLAVGDAQLKQQLTRMSKEELVQFFTNYIGKHVVEPCKSFVANMQEVMGVGGTFGLPGSWSGDVDEPSEEWVVLRSRLVMCIYASTKKSMYIEGFANMAADEFLIMKNYN